MIPRTPAEQARFIFTNGRVVKDFVDHKITDILAAGGSRSVCRDLSVTQMHVLMHVEKRGKVSITELATLMGVSAASASAMVERLVEKRALTRAPSAVDRRRMEVRLTPTVQNDFAMVDKILMAAFEELIAKIGPATTRKWCEVLACIREVLDAADAPPTSSVAS
jgi:DNA-binding MarR family transcriptional regulator